MRLPFLKKEEKVVDDADAYTELPLEEEEQKKISIMIEKLESLADVDKVMRAVRQGNIVVVKIRELKDQNLDELKHAISKMKTACATLDGDIAGVGEDWVIVTPSTARVAREGA
ncbi:MAG: cell division protein SepF [Candidatus Aenigmarchaeota archaeon]|nr:cell division protein SepF [Candidatus Aenigmarchaeota archaeon]